MNNLEQFKNHIEYNGYAITNEYDDGSYIAESQRYGQICVTPIGNDSSIGIRLHKLYPISIENCISNTEKIELYDMVNEMNKTLAIVTCALLDQENGLGMSYSMVGYDKTKAARVLEAFHLDCEQIFEFNLERFWTKEAVA